MVAVSNRTRQFTSARQPLLCSISLGLLLLQASLAAAFTTTSNPTTTLKCYDQQFRYRQPLSGRLVPSNSWSVRSSHHSNRNEPDRNDSNEKLHQDEMESYTSQQPNEQRPTMGKIISASLLIAGITVGGGFLALPSVVVPNGFLPSAVALVGVWFFFLLQSTLVVQALCHTNLMVSRNEVQQSRTNSLPPPPGIAMAARYAFGASRWAEFAIQGLLVILVKATLVSQIARAGSFFPPQFYRLGCLVSTFAIATIVFGTSTTSLDSKGTKSLSTRLNSILTLTFGIMAALLFVQGIPAANWHNLVSYSRWEQLPNAIPTFLQLLVYGEILPTICQMLQYHIPSIRKAILLGSLMPLILEVGWAGLGLGLMPESLSISKYVDPIDILLQTGGPVQIPLLCLALSAIGTTILGSFLALQSTFEDWTSRLPTKPSSSKSTKDSQEGATRKSADWKKRLSMAMFCTIPSASIATISPSMFLQAIDFCGSYPVVILWGLVPPLMVHRLQSMSSDVKAPRRIPNWLTSALFLVSFGLFGMSAVPDLLSVVSIARRFFA